MEKSAIERARDILGGTGAMAAALEITAPTVSEWVSGRRQVPAERCPTIERLTKGDVTCEQLRSDVDWAYLRKTPKKKAA